MQFKIDRCKSDLEIQIAYFSITDKIAQWILQFNLMDKMIKKIDN